MVAKLPVLLAIITLLAVPLLSKPVPTSAANSVQLSLSPSSQSTTTGSNLVVAVVVNPSGASINTVQSVLTYSASQYSFVSITPGAAFSSFPSPVQGSGSVQFSAASTTAVTTTQTVATLTLKANTAGTSNINLASVCPAGNYALTCSAAYDSVSSLNDLATVAGGSYSVTAPVTPPPSGGGSGSLGGGSTGSTGSSGSTSSGSTKSSSGSGSTSGGGSAPATGSSGTTAAPVTDPAPKISGIQVTNISATSATVTWQTDIAATSVVNYGLNTTYGLAAQSSDPTTNHSVTLSAPELTQGTTYYFVVASASSTGASSTSDGQQFTTTGFSVTINVVDQDGKPIAGVEVTLDGKTATSDKDGVAVFQNVPAGKRTVSVHSGRGVVQRTVAVGAYDAKTGKYLQQFSLTASRGSTPIFLYVLLVLIAIVGAFVILSGPSRVRNIIRKLLDNFRKPPASGPGPSNDIDLNSPPSTPPSGNSVIAPGSKTVTTEPTPVMPVTPAPAPTENAVVASTPQAPPAPTPAPAPPVSAPTAAQQPQAGGGMNTTLERLKTPNGPAPGTVFRPSSNR